MNAIRDLWTVSMKLNPLLKKTRTPPICRDQIPEDIRITDPDMNHYSPN
jgi:hypothetical protein